MQLTGEGSGRLTDFSLARRHKGRQVLPLPVAEWLKPKKQLLSSLAEPSCQSSRPAARHCQARPVEQSRSLLQGEDGGRSENFAGAARKGQREPKERG